MKENLSLAKDKFVLIDTNILIDSIKDVDSFSPMYEEMSRINANPILDELIHFEFVRNLRNYEERNVMESFLKKIILDPMTLMIDKQVIQDAITLTMIYSRHNSTNVDLTDCMIASQMKKFGDRVILITQNHKDYPLCIFNLIGAFTIRGKDKIHTVGMYIFSEKKFKEHSARL